MEKIKVSYVTTLPKIGNSPRVEIQGFPDKKYDVYFIDRKDGSFAFTTCNGGQTAVCGLKQWYTDWQILVKCENKIVFEDFFDPYGKVVFIKMDGHALGDNIAWIPYVEEFRKKHRCTVICSTFFNELFVDAYPEILFVKPNTIVENVYAQFYVGASDDGNTVYSPIDVYSHPLQMTSSAILGLKNEELRPCLWKKFIGSERKISKKYVTLSEHGSTPLKKWKQKNGWQKVVDFLKEKGYEILVISREPTELKNVVDLTGNINIMDRALDIYHSEFHLGISSGLSWLAWGLGKHVVMVSDTTPPWHEFNSDITRFCANEISRVDFNILGETDSEDVIKAISKLID